MRAGLTFIKGSRALLAPLHWRAPVGHCALCERFWSTRRGGWRCAGQTGLLEYSEAHTALASLLDKLRRRHTQEPQVDIADSHYGVPITRRASAENVGFGLVLASMAALSLFESGGILFEWVVRGFKELSPLSRLLSDYGYLAVFVSSVLQVQAILVLAGFAAHQGYLSLSWVVALAFFGEALGTQVYFLLGRRHGEALLRRYPRMSKPAQRVNRGLVRFQKGLVVGVRFVYGLQTLGPFVIGMSDVPSGRFALLNVIGAVIWSVTFTAIGFQFGNALQWLLPLAEQYEAVALLLALLLIAGIACLYAFLHRRQPDDPCRQGQGRGLALLAKEASRENSC